MKIPRNIFTYWHQGFSEAPAIVQACVAQLSHVNPGWKIYTLDQHSVQDFLGPISISADKLSNLSVQHRSDLLRTQLLIDHGGVWADPTVFVTQPFEDWLPGNIAAGLFLFSKPGRDRLISNWFIAAVPQHPILVRLYDELCRYWNDNNFRNLGREPNMYEQFLLRAVNRNLVWPDLWFSFPARKLLRFAPYFVYHYMFRRIVNVDESNRSLFAEMPVFPAEGSIRLQRTGLGRTFGAEAEKIVSDNDVPLHKLYHRLPSRVEPNSTLQHLVDIALKVNAN